MSTEQIVLQYEAGAEIRDVGVSAVQSTVEAGEATAEEYKGWEKVRRKVLSVVGASLNFHTLRDMYNEVTLDPSRLTPITKIGEGNYGTVSKYGYLEADGNTSYLAIKCLRSDSPAQATLDFMKEVKILRQLKNEHIVAFRGTGYLKSENDDDDDDLFLALELMEGGSLRELLERQRVKQTRGSDEKLYTLSQGLEWLLGIASALSYLHASEPLVIHRDLKPENIMLTKDKKAKIVDFGLHRAIDRYEREYVEDDGMYDMTGAPGAYLYMAPEAILSQRYNHKVDVYSFACIAWEIAHYQLLISATCTTGSKEEVQNYARHVCEKAYRPVIVSSLVPKDLALLIQDMWKQDPNERPEFEEIVKRLRVLCDEVKQAEATAKENSSVEHEHHSHKCSWFRCCFGY